MQFTMLRMAILLLAIMELTYSLSLQPSSLGLHDKTVKELRQAIKDNGLYERGIMNRLKRKGDLIDFLERNLSTKEGELATTPTIRDKPHISQEVKDIRAENHTLSSLSEGILEGSNIDSSIQNLLPPWLQSNLAKYDISCLLPIQQESFHRIYQREDTVLNAPTGQGKTLAFCLPLLAAPRQKRRQGGMGSNGVIASPKILCICPSRELAQQVGKEFERFSKKDKKEGKGGVNVATVFGGVPMERHLSLLKRTRPKVLIATPGRLRELVREGHVSYDQVRTLVLDEADILLDAADSPDVQAILREMEEDIGGACESDEDGAYQMVLVSATLNQEIRSFLREMEIPKQALCTVTRSPVDAIEESSAEFLLSAPRVAPAVVQHWHMACRSSARVDVAADIISSWSPQVTIIFVPTKSETEDVMELLNRRLGGSGQIAVKALHGDMPQTARTRTLNQIRAEQQRTDTPIPQVLVATDVASRGLDLPQVELVLQFGIPRQSGKEGTYNTELYIHRTGRVGRVRQGSFQRQSNAVVLLDPNSPERRLLDELAIEFERNTGIPIKKRPIPSTQDIINAGYGRARESVKDGTQNEELTLHFENLLRKDLNDSELSDPDILLRLLAQNMVTLSRLDPEITPTKPHRSLLCGDTGLRTLRVKAPHEVKPSDITQFCKGLGSGKVGLVTIESDGLTAVLDLPNKKAGRLLKTWEEQKGSLVGWTVEAPLQLEDFSI